MSPFVHVATGADFASPSPMPATRGSATSTATSRSICTVFPSHHGRLRRGQPSRHDGIAIGECWLYDEQGPIGTSTVAALAQRKPMTNVPPP